MTSNPPPKSLRELCKRVEELDKKATKGPWTSLSDRVQETQIIDRQNIGAVIIDADANRDDLRLIASYRSLAPQIARRAMVLEEQLKIARFGLESKCTCGPSKCDVCFTLDHIAALEGGLG